MKHLKDTKQVDVNKTDNLCNYTKVDVGFSANRLVRDLMAKKNISDKQLMDFHMECRSFLQAVVRKLLAKSPLDYKLVKYLSVFDPRRMAADDQLDVNKLLLRNLLQHFVEYIYIYKIYRS